MATSEVWWPLSFFAHVLFGMDFDCARGPIVGYLESSWPCAILELLYMALSLGEKEPKFKSFDASSIQFTCDIWSLIYPPPLPNPRCAYTILTRDILGEAWNFVNIKSNTWIYAWICEVLTSINLQSANYQPLQDMGILSRTGFLGYSVEYFDCEKLYAQLVAL